jgi:hypothetical protein
MSLCYATTFMQIGQVVFARTTYFFKLIIESI